MKRCYARRLLLTTYSLLLIVVLPLPALAFPDIKSTFPRTVNYFLHWTLSEEEARDLSKFDLVILDAEVPLRSPSEFAMLRRLHPEIVLLAYVPASEVRRDGLSLQSIAPLRYKLASTMSKAWYVRDAGGAQRSFWPGTWIVNVTEEAPVVSGKRWTDFLSDFVVQEVLKDDTWDGVLYDNAWDDIIHFAGGVPDLNGDGIAETPDIAKRTWQDGLRSLYAKTIAKAPRKLVMENDGVLYAPALHGVLLENFPRKGWTQHMQDIQRVRTLGQGPALPMLNANTGNTGNRGDYRAMRYGLASALLGDAFYGFDFGDQDHGQAWLYDEYSIFLGEPLGQARPREQLKSGFTPGLWQRDFENGLVLVNAGAEPRTITLPIDVERYRGTQDPETNNGMLAREITVAAHDGLIVLRPLVALPGAPYENGVFARVFSAKGGSASGGNATFEVSRAGFFAFDKTEARGTMLLSTDLDGDTKPERLRVNNGRVHIAFGDGAESNFTPLGYTAGSVLSIAAANLSGDGVKDIVVASSGTKKTPANIQVFRPDGTLIKPPFFPFGPNYRGELTVAAGDLNNDGFSEIVVGAGAGGGPQVRIFSREGKLLSGGFFAYDPRFRGGVRVAVGDVDNDGESEIVTGPGIGGGPQIRIFTSKGIPKGQGFFAFDRASRTGATPIVTDVDGDGKAELLAVTKEIL